MGNHPVTRRGSIRDPCGMHMARCGDAETWSGRGDMPQRPPGEQEPENIRNFPIIGVYVHTRCIGQT